MKEIQKILNCEWPALRIKQWSTKGSVEIREKEEKKKIEEKFGIASGILKSRALFLAPITGMENENELLIPPPSSDDPNERRIVRRLCKGIELLRQKCQGH